MFHSKHPKAALHAAARAVSGAAVYVSDLPGAHDFALLRRMVLPDGSVLRARLPGRPTRDALFADVLRDRRSVLKARAGPCQGPCWAARPPYIPCPRSPWVCCASGARCFRRAITALPVARPARGRAMRARRTRDRKARAVGAVQRCRAQAGAAPALLQGTRAADGLVGAPRRSGT